MSVQPILIYYHITTLQYQILYFIVTSYIVTIIYSLVLIVIHWREKPCFDYNVQSTLSFQYWLFVLTLQDSSSAGNIHGLNKCRVEDLSSDISQVDVLSASSQYGYIPGQDGIWVEWDRTEVAVARCDRRRRQQRIGESRVYHIEQGDCMLCAHSRMQMESRRANEKNKTSQSFLVFVPAIAQAV